VNDFRRSKDAREAVPTHPATPIRTKISSGCHSETCSWKAAAARRSVGLLSLARRRLCVRPIEPAFTGHITVQT